MFTTAFLVVALKLFLLLGVTRSPVRTYTGAGLSPCYYPEEARTDSVKLAPGVYVAGQLVGAMSTLTAGNDVQTLTFGGTPTGGTFRLSFNGVETADITFVAVAATLAAAITAALEALPQIGTGNVTTSSSLTVPAVTFAGDLAGQWQPLLVNTVNAMTSGTTATLSIAHTTPGRTLGGTWRSYSDGNSDGTEVAKAIVQYPVTVLPNGRHYYLDPTWSAGRLSAPVWIKGYFRTADLTGIDAAAVTDLGRIVEGAVGSLTNVATVLKMN